MPKTRDRYISNPLSSILQPKIAARLEAKNYFHHDKLDVRDIEGTNSNTYGKLKLI